MATHNKTGEIGEATVADYLRQQGFFIMDRNYNRKWGELDIVAQKKEVTHFIEVKTTGVPQDSSKKDTTRPIEKVDQRKLQRLSRAIQTYCLENNMKLETLSWQFDVYVVYLDHEKKEARLEVVENIVIGD